MSSSSSSSSSKERVYVDASDDDGDLDPKMARKGKQLLQDLRAIKEEMGDFIVPLSEYHKDQLDEFIAKLKAHKAWAIADRPQIRELMVVKDVNAKIKTAITSIAAMEEDATTKCLELYVDFVDTAPELDGKESVVMGSLTLVRATEKDSWKAKETKRKGSDTARAQFTSDMIVIAGAEAEKRKGILDVDVTMPTDQSKGADTRIEEAIRQAVIKQVASGKTPDNKFQTTMLKQISEAYAQTATKPAEQDTAQFRGPYIPVTTDDQATRLKEIDEEYTMAAAKPEEKDAETRLRDLCTPTTTGDLVFASVAAADLHVGGLTTAQKQQANYCRSGFMYDEDTQTAKRGYISIDETIDSDGTHTHTPSVTFLDGTEFEFNSKEKRERLSASSSSSSASEPDAETVADLRADRMFEPTPPLRSASRGEASTTATADSTQSPAPSTSDIPSHTPIKTAKKDKKKKKTKLGRPAAVERRLQLLEEEAAKKRFEETLAQEPMADSSVGLAAAPEANYYRSHSRVGLAAAPEAGYYRSYRSQFMLRQAQAIAQSVASTTSLLAMAAMKEQMDAPGK